MHSLLLQIVVTIVATAALLLPGGALLGATRLGIALPPQLRPVAACALTLLALAVGLIPQLALHLPFHWLAQWMIAVTVVAAWVAARRLWRVWPQRNPLLRAGAIALQLLQVRAFVLVGWPLATLTLLTALAAFVIGGSLADGDPQYHAAVARKLLELPDPSFAGTQLFIDGSVHPGYVVPALQALVALVAWLARADVLTVMWVLPAPILALSTLSAAGLTRVLFRSHTAALVGALAFLTSDIAAGAPAFGLVKGATFPGTVVVLVLLPLAVATWITSNWHRSSGIRSRALIMLLATTALTVVLHVNYVVWIAMAVVGYLLFWLVAGPWPRAVVRLHLRSSVALALIAVACLGALYPVLASLSSFAGTGGQTEAKNAWVSFRPILVGTMDHYHLRPDFIVAAGVLAMLGMCVAPVALYWRREPFAWYIAGTTFVTLATSQWPTLFTAFSHVASVSQSKRIGYALPHAVGIAFALLLIGHLVSRVWHRRRLRLPLLVAAALVGIAVEVVVASTGRLVHVLDAAQLPSWPTTLTLWALVAEFVVLAAAWIWRLRSNRVTTAPQLPTAPALPINAGGALAIALVLTIGAFPTLRTSASTIVHDARHRPANALRVDDMRSLDRTIVARLRSSRYRGRVLLAPVPVALRWAAAVPLYVTAVPLSHVAGTAANRRDLRRNIVNEFYRCSTSDRRRLAIVRHEHVDLLLLGGNCPLPVAAQGGTSFVTAIQGRSLHVDLLRLR